MRLSGVQKRGPRQAVYGAGVAGGVAMANADDTVNEVMAEPYLFVLNRPALGSAEVLDSASRTLVEAVLVLKDARLDSKWARPHPDGLIVMAGRQAYVVAPSLKPQPGGGKQFSASLATSADLKLAGVEGAAGWST